MPEAKNMKIFEKFRCIADKCKDNCCAHNWNIDIDPPTYERWQALANETDRTYLLSNVEETGGNITFKRNTQGNCIHLDEHMLCKIHDRYGPELLPQVCHTYPRLHLKGIDRVSQALQLSCPEVTRLVFESGDEDLFATAPCGLDETLDPANFNPALVEINRTMVAYFERMPFDAELAIGGYMYDISNVLDYITEQARAETLTPEMLAKRCGASTSTVKLNSTGSAAPTRS